MFRYPFPLCLYCNVIQDAGSILDPRAAAAVGQSELMAMYDAMFSQYNVKIAQVSHVNALAYNSKALAI